MDHAATTPIHPEVATVMKTYLEGHFGNPSSIYSIARESKEAVEKARGKVAQAMGAREDEIYFSSGGTESDNWAIKGSALALRKKGDHINYSKARSLFQVFDIIDFRMTGIRHISQQVWMA